MKRTNMITRALRFGVLAFALPVVTQAATYNLVSGPSWMVMDANMNILGNAQNYCLNATEPPNCPPGATLYGYPLVGWTANLSSIPGATWIWAPNITGTTPGAAGATFIFQTQFYVCGTPQGGTISVAADNSAQVSINGNPLLLPNGQVFTATSHLTLSTVAVPASMLNQAPTVNTITVVATNGPDPGNCASDLYQCNPAGFVLGASFTDSLSSLPTCTETNGQVVPVGTLETFSCPSGDTGSPSRLCICVGSNGFWTPTEGTCTAAQVCIDANTGGSWPVGGTENFGCPPGQTGTNSRQCVAANKWGPITNTCAVPTCVDTINGVTTTFNVGAMETAPCDPGQIGGPKSRVCQAGGIWTPWDTSKCVACAAGSVCTGTNGTTCCGTGQLCCMGNGLPGNRQCVTPIEPPPWCAENQPTYVDCSVPPASVCASMPGTTCKARCHTTGHHSIGCALFGWNCPVTVCSTDLYCDP
jgi:hypothetical protein